MVYSPCTPPLPTVWDTIMCSFHSLQITVTGMCVGLGEPVDELHVIQGLVSIAQSHVDSHAETLKHAGLHSTNTSLGKCDTATHHANIGDSPATHLAYSGDSPGTHLAYSGDSPGTHLALCGDSTATHSANIGDSPVIHLAYSGDSPAMHHANIGDSPAMHHTNIGDSPAMHHANIGDSPAMHHTNIGDSPAMHHANIGDSPATHHTNIGDSTVTNLSRSRDPATHLERGGVSPTIHQANIGDSPGTHLAHSGDSPAMHHANIGDTPAAMHPTLSDTADYPAPCTTITDITKTQSTSFSGKTLQDAVPFTLAPNTHSDTLAAHGSMHGQGARPKIPTLSQQSRTITNIRPSTSLPLPNSPPHIPVTPPYTSTKSKGTLFRKGSFSRHSTKFGLGKHFTFSLGQMQRKYRVLRKYLPGSLRRTYSGTLFNTKGLGHCISLLSGCV